MEDLGKNVEKEYERNRRSKVFYKRSESILSPKRNDRSVPNTRKIFPVKSVRLTKKAIWRSTRRVASYKETWELRHLVSRNLWFWPLRTSRRSYRRLNVYTCYTYLSINWQRAAYFSLPCIRPTADAKFENLPILWSGHAITSGHAFVCVCGQVFEQRKEKGRFTVVTFNQVKII